MEIDFKFIIPVMVVSTFADDCGDSLVISYDWFKGYKFSYKCCEPQPIFRLELYLYLRKILEILYFQSHP